MFLIAVYFNFTHSLPFRQKASEINLHVLVDAEKVNINPCLDLIAMALMKKFNTKKAFIWNTYQCYLKVSGNATS